MSIVFNINKELSRSFQTQQIYNLPPDFRNVLLKMLFWQVAQFVRNMILCYKVKTFRKVWRSFKVLTMLKQTQIVLNWTYHSRTKEL